MATANALGRLVVRATLALALLLVLCGLEGPLRFVKISEPLTARAKAASLHSKKWEY